MKKVLSLILSVALLFSCLLPTEAAAVETDRKAAPQASLEAPEIGDNMAAAVDGEKSDPTTSAKLQAVERGFSLTEPVACVVNGTWIRHMLLEDALSELDQKSREVPFLSSDLVQKDGVTRGEWLHDLVVMFDMTVQDTGRPDKYYPDLASSHLYYNDILTAIEFGVVDVPAGEQLCPDDPATRDFAAKTLNFCLGFQTESTQYSFSDAEACSDPDSAQIAIDRGWFSIIGGTFSPDARITADEIGEMAQDVQTILTYSHVEDGYSSTYVFADSVVVIPKGTTVNIDQSNTVTVIGASEKIKNGDTFVVYFSDIPSVYLAKSVTTTGTITRIATAEADVEKALIAADASGSVEVDLSGFQAEDGVSAAYVSTQAQAATLAQTYGIEVKKGSVVATKDIVVGDGLKVTLVCDLSNLKLEHNFQTSIHNYYFAITGVSAITSTVSIDLISAMGGSASVTLGSVNIAGVGTVTISVELALNGKMSCTYTGSFKVGAQYAPKSGARLDCSFVKRNFSTDAEANASIGVKVNAGVDLILASGNLYATTGLAAKYVSHTYHDGESPDRCVNISGWLYASVGANAKVGFGSFSKSFKKTKEIYNSSNSPVEISCHFEDGTRVWSCARGNEDYFTPSDSYYGGSSYGGGSSVGVGSDGKPYTIYTYRIDKEENITVTGYRGNVSALSIPSTIDGYTVTEIGTSAFKGNLRLASIIVPDTVTKIGDSAFSKCENLQTILLPDSVTEIGSDAFAECGLTSLKLPAQIEKLGTDFLRGTMGVKEIFIPKTVTRMMSSSFWYNGEGAFRKSGIETATFETGMTVIPGGAFYGCETLKNVTIPDTVIKIEERAFSDCKNLETITLPVQLKELETDFLRGTMGVKEIFIPKTVTKMMTSSFWYDGQGAFHGSGIETATFETGMTVIPGGAFYGCETLKNVTIPDTVIKIEERAFSGCKSLETITLPDSITEIGDGALAGSGLTSLKLPVQTEKLGTDFLRGTMGVKEIFIPKTVTKMITAGLWYEGEGAFYGSGIETATFETGMTVIPEGAFNGCETLKNVTIPDTVIKINGWAFLDCAALKEITLPAGVVEIGEAAFSGSGLRKAILPDAAVKMGTRVYKNCTSLETATLSKNLTRIADETFSGCTALQIFQVPDLVTEIGANSFSDCASLRQFTFGKQVKKLGDSAFQNCDALETLNIPMTVTTLGEGVFYDCDGITSLVLPNSVVNAGAELFYDCDKLTSVTLSTGLSDIGDAMFSYCDVLEDVLIPYYVKTVGKNVFQACIALKSVTIPRNVTAIGSNAFSYLDRVTIYGVAGSYAESYADSNHIRFVPQEVKAVSAATQPAVLTMNKGASVRLSLSVTPLNFTDEVFWKTGNASVVTVTDNGTLRAIGVGSTTVKVNVGDISATCTVTVVQPVTSVRLNTSQISLDAGKTFQLTATVLPGDAGNKALSWSTSAPDIVKVDGSGLVTALQKGTAVITATAQDGSNVEGQCTVTVKNTVHVVTDPTQMESPHEYPANCSDFWVYSIPGAAALQVTFDARTALEKDFDFLYLFDSADQKIGTYTGDALAGATITVPGDTVRIQLVSDGGGSAWGFRVTKVEASEKSGSSGDINGDGAIDNRDLTRLFQHLSGWNTGTDLSALDINGDGEVDNKDLTRLFQMISGWEI